MTWTPRKYIRVLGFLALGKALEPLLIADRWYRARTKR